MHTRSKLAAAGASALAVAAAVAGVSSAKTTAHSSASSAVFSSVISLDRGARTVTLPLFTGHTATGAKTYYIVTDSSDQADATKRGVNFAPKLKNALGTKAVEKVTTSGGTITFPGTVNFKPTLKLVPNKKTGFPPDKFAPGAVGDSKYSPLITTGNGIVLNAAQVSNDSGNNDTVVKIDKAGGRVTLALFAGFVQGRPNLYLRTDGSNPLLASLESTAYAKNLDAAPGIGSDGAKSARSAISPIVNGPLGKKNPSRQGLDSALMGQGQPLNVEQSVPGSPDWSPIWDVTPVVWTKSAIAKHQRKLLKSSAQIAAGVKAGQITSLGKSKANSSLGGLKAIGFVSNCPIVWIG